METGRITTITDLPDPIIVDIFLLLPAKNLLACRCVCKSWRSLITSPNFAKLHSSLPPRTELLVHSSDLGKTTFNVFEPEFDPVRVINISPRFEIPNNHQQESPTYYAQPPRYAVVNSCRGLLYLLDVVNVEHNFSIICNPLTGEYITIPDHGENSGNRKSYCWATTGFGYCSSTNQFKLLRVSCMNSTWIVEILVVGSDSWWRRISAENYWLIFASCNEPVLYQNQILHWEGHEVITRFDFESEMFGEICLPPSDDDDTVTCLGILGDCLAVSCFANCGSASEMRFVIWIMKEYGKRESWTRDFVIDLTHYLDMGISDHSLLVVERLGNGDIFIYSPAESVFICYNPVKQSTRILHSPGRKCGALAFTPTFLSLKDSSILGQNLNVMNFNSRPAARVQSYRNLYPHNNYLPAAYPSPNSITWIIQQYYSPVCVPATPYPPALYSQDTAVYFPVPYTPAAAAAYPLVPYPPGTYHPPLYNSCQYGPFTTYSPALYSRNPPPATHQPPLYDPYSPGLYPGTYLPPYRANSSTDKGMN